MRKKAAIIFFGVLLVLLVALVAWPFVAEWLVVRGFDREELTRYREWRDKELTIPQAALHPAPFLRATEGAAGEFDSMWTKYQKRAQAVDSGKTPPFDPTSASFDTTKTQAALVELEPLLKSFETLVAQPDYELSAAGAGRLWDETSGFPFDSFTRTRSCSRLLRLRATCEAKAGRVEKAIEISAVVGRAGRTDPYSDLLVQLTGEAVFGIGVATFRDVLTSCTSPQLLRQGLVKMNDMSRQKTYLSTGLSPEAVDRIGTIREMNRRGMAEYPQKITARDLLETSCLATVNYFRKIVLPQYESDPRQAPKIRKTIAAWEKDARSFGVGPASLNPVHLYRRMTARANNASFYVNYVPSLEGVATHQKSKSAWLDDLRLRIARRIWTLERGAPPASMADLVPGLLPEMPKDPFAKDGAPYREVKGVCYSIGPDGIDQKGAMAYDPSNGTRSTGDIVFGR